MKIICTHSGGEFTPGHVQALARQCAQFAPGHEFICITNHNIPGVATLPRTHPEWEGWWVEMEMFNPAIKGPILYLDIDTVIVGDMSHILARNELTVLQDAYRHNEMQDSVMLIPEEHRPDIWHHWLCNEAEWRGAKWKMQTMLTRLWPTAARWQSVLPRQLVSWKVDCHGQVPLEARVVYFHGQPRPWATRTFAHLYT
jgi:hypothetical protein